VKKKESISLSYIDCELLRILKGMNCDIIQGTLKPY